MKLRSMTRCALCAALMAVCAWIALPVGSIALSLQTFGVFLTLGLLGGRRGTMSIFVYLLLGAVGLPVFSGFRGGIGILLGPTGGYLWGFLLAGLAYWILENRVPSWFAMALGMGACYICGTVWFYIGYGQTGLWTVVMQCVAPFLLPDAMKLLGADVLSKKLKNFA